MYGGNPTNAAARSIFKQCSWSIVQTAGLMNQRIAGGNTELSLEDGEMSVLTASLHSWIDRLASQVKAPWDIQTAGVPVRMYASRSAERQHERCTLANLGMAAFVTENMAFAWIKSTMRIILFLVRKCEKGSCREIIKCGRMSSSSYRVHLDGRFLQLYTCIICNSSQLKIDFHFMQKPLQWHCRCTHVESCSFGNSQSSVEW
jgi:hypothetical protein